MLTTALPLRATPSAHRLGLGLPGYLILFAPLAFVSQRQGRSRELPSPSAFLAISTHSTATPQVLLSSPVLKPNSIECSSSIELRDFTVNLLDRLHTLYTQ